MSSEDCSICCEPYNVTDRRPVLTPNCCGNTLCLQCAESHRAVQVAELSGNRKKIPCPLGCGAPFHSETGKFIVNRDKLRSLEAEGTGAAGGSSSASSLAAASSEAAPSPDNSGTGEIENDAFDATCLLRTAARPSTRWTEAAAKLNPIKPLYRRCEHFVRS